MHFTHVVLLYYIPLLIVLLLIFLLSSEGERYNELATLTQEKLEQNTTD